MYKIKENVDLNTLPSYGFKIGHDYPDNQRCICNERDRDDFWLIPLEPGNENKIYYANDDNDQPIWSIHIQKSRNIWIDCVPSCTYHIDNSDMEYMFYILKKMIEDGIIEDDYVVVI